MPVLRASGWGGGAGRGVEQRSLLIAAPILEHGRPEMEKSCREWTSRLLASAGFRGSVERTDRGKVLVGHSCPRVVHDRVHVDPRAKRRFRGSRPRKPPINRPLARPRRWNSSANEFVGSAGGINTGQSHRRKWPYNLSPSGRGAINRAALSANELLLSLLPPPPFAPSPRARELKIDEEDWRCFRLIDREVYLGLPASNCDFSW